MKKYDCIVVGAGPAGSTLSLLLQDKNMKIAVIDKRPFDEDYDFNNPNLKSCGGLLAPDAQKSFAKLDLNLPKYVTTDPQIFSVKTIDFENNLTKHYQRFYVNMNRELFDRFLMQQTTSKNVETYFSHSVVSIKDIGNEFRVCIKDKNSNVEEISAKYIVGADGAMSKVRNSLFKNISVNQYGSLQRVYKCIDEKPQFISIFDTRLTDYYGWGFTKGEYFYLGLATPKGYNAKEKLDTMENQLKNYGYEFGEVIRDEGTVLLRPKKISQITSCNGRAFLIGEAGNFVSPSSAEGISFALDSAIALFKSFNQGGNIEKNFQKNTRKLKLKIRIKDLKRKVMYNKNLRKIIMKSNFEAISKLDKSTH